MLPFCKLIFKYLLLTSAKPCHPELVKPPVMAMNMIDINICATTQIHGKEKFRDSISPLTSLVAMGQTKANARAQPIRFAKK